MWKTKKGPGSNPHGLLNGSGARKPKKKKKTNNVVVDSLSTVIVELEDVVNVPTLPKLSLVVTFPPLAKEVVAIQMESVCKLNQ